MGKPGSWLVLAKCMKTIRGIVRFYANMQVNYDAPSVVWESVDARPSGRHSWLQIFSTHFPSGIGYLLSLKAILSPKKSQQTNTCSNTCFEQSQKSPSLFELNFECLLKPFIWFTLACKWLDKFPYDTSSC